MHILVVPTLQQPAKCALLKFCSLFTAKTQLADSSRQSRSYLDKNQLKLFASRRLAYSGQGSHAERRHTYTNLTDNQVQIRECVCAFLLGKGKTKEREKEKRGLKIVFNC